jgi:hypothetical protein
MSHETMISDGSYRRALPPHVARERLAEGFGGQVRATAARALRHILAGVVPSSTPTERISISWVGADVCDCVLAHLGEMMASLQTRRVEATEPRIRGILGDVGRLVLAYTEGTAIWLLPQREPDRS